MIMIFGALDVGMLSAKLSGFRATLGSSKYSDQHRGFSKKHDQPITVLFAGFVALQIVILKI